jgi:hypothetical protein
MDAGDGRVANYNYNHDYNHEYTGKLGTWYPDWHTGP